MGWQDLFDGGEPAGTAAREGGVGGRYRDVGCRRVLDAARASSSPGALSLDPYLNCELGCLFCPGRDDAARRLRSPSGGRVEAEVFVKRGAASALRRELGRLAAQGRLARPIVLGTASDPYQPVEAERRVTRGLLEVLLDAAAAAPRERAPRLTIATKSDLVLRDVDLLAELTRRAHLRVQVGLSSVDPELAAHLEPGAPSPARRLEVVRILGAAGVPAGVGLMPILPELTCGSRDVRRVVCAAREAGAGWLAARVLVLGRGARDAFLAWLEAHHPHLVRPYRRLYRRAQPPEPVRDRIRRLVTALRRQYGLPAEQPFPKPPPRLAAQLELFSFQATGARASDSRRPRRLPAILPGAA